MPQAYHNLAIALVRRARLAANNAAVTTPPSNAVPVIPFHRARADLLARASELSAPVVIGITGRVGAGKSTLAASLTPCVLSTDDYLPDYDTVPEAQRDDPRHADFATLVANITLLRAGRPARVPVWSFHTHRREGETLREPAAIIVVEGIHALHASLRATLQMRVFVEASPATRWNRWEALERSGVRGWGVAKAREFFHAVAEPTFARWEDEYRAAAHVIVANDA